MPPAGEILTFIVLAGGVSGLVTIVSLPWTRRRILSASNLDDATATSTATKTAIESMEKALQAAETRAQRLESQLADANEQVGSLRDTLARERSAAEDERKLHEIRVGKLLMEIAAKDEHLHRLRARFEEH